MQVCVKNNYFLNTNEKTTAKEYPNSRKIINVADGVESLLFDASESKTKMNAYVL